jgi:8-oxo-dGTP diphosphatase
MTSPRSAGAAPLVAVAGIAFDDAGRVLLIRRGRPPGQGLWTVPGGRVELGEGMREACAREVREETGLEVEVGAVVEVVERIGRGGVGEVSYHYVIVDFLVEPVGGELRAASDASDARFVSAGELGSLALTEGLVPVIEAARTLARNR